MLGALFFLLPRAPVPLTFFLICVGVVKIRMSSNRSRLPLILLLPRKVRRRIYRFLLVSDQPLRIWRFRDNGSYSPPNCLFPAILSTCRIVHCEATMVLYGENVFVAHRLLGRNIPVDSRPRAKILLRAIHPNDADFAYRELPMLIRRHSILKHLWLEDGVCFLDVLKFRIDISKLVLSLCSSKVPVRTNFQPYRCFRMVPW
jgi:hypothetical protein